MDARRTRAQRQRRGGRAWHRGAGTRPARRARTGDRPCIHLVRQSWAHSDPCAAATLCPRGRDVAKGIGSGQTRRSAHRPQGRVVGGGDSASLGSCLMRVRPAGWRRPLRCARRSKLCVGKAGADAAALQLAALTASDPPLRSWRGAHATWSRCKRSGRLRLHRRTQLSAGRHHAPPWLQQHARTCERARPRAAAW